jgi:hypothetical protein
MFKVINEAGKGLCIYQSASQSMNLLKRLTALKTPKLKVRNWQKLSYWTLKILVDSNAT